MRLFSRCTAALILSTSLIPATSAISGETTYKAVCMACHATGVSGSPKLGDRQAWSARIAEGQSVLTAHAYVGLGAMPPKGGKPDLSLEDFASTVVFMANQAGAQWRNPDAKQLQAMRTEITKREKELAAQRTKK